MCKKQVTAIYLRFYQTFKKIQMLKKDFFSADNSKMTTSSMLASFILIVRFKQFSKLFLDVLYNEHSKKKLFTFTRQAPHLQASFNCIKK